LPLQRCKDRIDQVASAKEQIATIRLRPETAAPYAKIKKYPRRKEKPRQGAFNILARKLRFVFRHLRRKERNSQNPSSSTNVGLCQADDFSFGFSAAVHAATRPDSDVDIALALMPGDGWTDWALGDYFALEGEWKRQPKAIVTPRDVRSCRVEAPTLPPRRGIPTTASPIRQSAGSSPSDHTRASVVALPTLWRVPTRQKGSLHPCKP